MLLPAIGYPSPASTPTEAASWAGEAQTRTAQSELQKFLPLGTDRLLQPVHLHLLAQPHHQVKHTRTHWCIKTQVCITWCVYAESSVFFLLASSQTNGKKAADSKGKKSKQLTLTYTAARLHEKGVLLEIEDLPVTQYGHIKGPPPRHTHTLLFTFFFIILFKLGSWQYTPGVLLLLKVCYRKSLSG